MRGSGFRGVGVEDLGSEGCLGCVRFWACSG